ncbi:hypothetical protein ACFXDH_49275 [Streptomyces sp. NPDC059467]
MPISFAADDGDNDDGNGNGNGNGNERETVLGEEGGGDHGRRIRRRSL